MSGPSVERVRALLSYDAVTGIFHWSVDRCNIKAGTKTGCLAANGYLYIRLDKKLHSAHRLAWLHHYGEWPSEQVDHINGDRTDNRISNLRACSNQQNQQNRRKAQSTSSTGVIGVSPGAKAGRYRAVIKKNRKLIALGTFDSIQDASDAYLSAKRSIHEFCTI